MLDIIDIEDGEIITKPGLYRMSLEWYHQQCCDGPSVSSSGLRTIITGSPWAFWATSRMNPNRYPEKSKDHFSLGKAAHALILGDEVWEEGYVVRPIEYTSWQTKNSKIWRDMMEIYGLTVVTPDQVITIGYMAENIAANPEARESLVSDLFEISMVWQDRITGLWIKSRVDALPTNGFDFADLKTFAPKSKSIKRAVHQSITDWRYDMQAALGIEGAEELGVGSAQECALVFSQTTEPYNVVTVRIDHDTLYWARVCNRKAMNTIAECLKTGEWAMPVEGIMDYSLPPSLTDAYAEMQSSGELPNI